MEEILAPFDREFKEILGTISMQSRLYIVALEKNLIERNFVENDPKFSSQD